MREEKREKFYILISPHPVLLKLHTIRRIIMSFLFHQETDVTKINDSLLLDNGTVIATGYDESTEYSAEIFVNGDTKLYFDGVCYKTPSEFPEELRQLIQKRKIFDSDRIELEYGNSFEIAIYSPEDEELYSDTIDAENMTSDELKELMKEILEDVYQEERETE